MEQNLQPGESSRLSYRSPDDHPSVNQISPRIVFAIYGTVLIALFAALGFLFTRTQSSFTLSELTNLLPSPTLIPTDFPVYVPTRFPTLTPTLAPTSTPFPTRIPTRRPTPTFTPTPKPVVQSNFRCDIFAFPDHEGVPVTYHLVYSAFTDNNAYVTGVQWDYNGDGNWDSDMSLNNGAVNYTYSTPGVYNIRMRVQVSDGRISDVCTRSIGVQPH